jgi:hypothetical protein
MTCGTSCQYSGRHTDAAKRISDATLLVWTGYEWDCVGKWMTFALEDGRNRDVYTVYPTKRDAVIHVDNELRYMFVKLHPGGMSMCEAEIMLQFTRKAVASGFRLTDPDARNGGRDVIPRITTEDIRAQLRALTRGNR